jgi:SAM-dependent methyltransferase
MHKSEETAVAHFSASYNSTHSYWSSLASSYAALGPPLCPSICELQFLERTIADWASANGSRNRIHALLLGVTPAIANMRWPAKSKLIAVDHSFPMTKSVWAGDVPGHRAVVCGDWRALPLPDASCDLVLADGSLSCLRSPDEARGVTAAISRVLSPGGILLMRCYLQSSPPERVDSIIESLSCAPPPSFHHFKLRLLMALQPDAHCGVAVRDAYQLWLDRKLDVTEVAARTGWSRESVEMIELYRDTATVYSFLTQAELGDILAEFFDPVISYTPIDPLGDRCPTLVLRSKLPTPPTV